MRKRQRISIDFNVRKPKLKINHSVSKYTNERKDESNKEVINNPYLAHTLNDSTLQVSSSPPPPPSPPPLPPPPPIINDTSSSLNYLLNYEDSSSESESEDNSVGVASEKEKESEKSNTEKKINEKSELKNSFEKFLSENNEIENNKDPNLVKKKENPVTSQRDIRTSGDSTYSIEKKAELSYHETSIIIINKLTYLCSDKSIIYTTTPTQDYLYHQIEFSTRFKDWSVGALNNDYFINYHNEINNLLKQIEEYFSPPGWKIQWDLNNSLYYYENKKTKIISWEYPKDIEEESEVFNQKVEKSDDEDDSMDLESDSEVISYTSSGKNIKEKSNKEDREKSHTPEQKIIKKSTKKDKNLLKLIQKWKEVEDSLNNSEEDEKIEKWAEEQKNKVDSSENPNFEPINGNWREKILKRRETFKDS